MTTNSRPTTARKTKLTTSSGNSLWSKNGNGYLPNQLSTFGVKDINITNLSTGGLSPDSASNMVENCVGVLSLPIGVGLYFLVNGYEYCVPMVTEEASVIAAGNPLIQPPLQPSSSKKMEMASDAHPQNPS